MLNEIITYANKKIRITLSLLALSLVQATAQSPIIFPDSTGNQHPRIYVNDAYHQEFYDLTAGGNDFYPYRYRVERRKVDDFANRHVTDSAWIISRLQMYWKSKSTIINVNDGVFVSASGSPAPVPTVRYAGNRDPNTNFNGELLDSLKPYSDSSLIYLYNTAANQWQWVAPQQTGYAIQEINEKILSLAATSGLAYWRTGFDKYAKFSYDIFKTYMQGMYYRSDSNTIVNAGTDGLADYGLQAFSIIKDYVAPSAAICYDFIYDYIRNRPGATPAQIDAEIQMYEETFRKWGMWTILHGTAANNWNSIKSNFAAHMALCLHDNHTYANGKGWQYYMNIIFNRDTALIASSPNPNHKGVINYLNDFDPQTAAWYEAPDYSTLVTDNILKTVQITANVSGLDLLSMPQLGILPNAVKATAQYLFPQKTTSAFGDSESGTMSAGSLESLIAYYRKKGNTTLEHQYTALYNMQFNTRVTNSYTGITRLLSYVNLFDTVAPATLAQYTTPLVFFPNTSWIMQRNGTDSLHGMAATLTAAAGKHFHENGLSMELSAKSVCLAPDAGRSKSSGYSTADYNEYYKQNIAHNTVIVNGKASPRRYLSLLAAYPESEQQSGYFPAVTFAAASYSELATSSAQNRLIATVRTGATTGYFIDIFRSRMNSATPTEKHEYFYHNVGDSVTLFNEASPAAAITMTTTSQLDTSNGYQVGYKYLTGKKTTVTNTDANGYYTGNIKARFKLNYSGRSVKCMDVWLNAAGNRKVYTVSSPTTNSFIGTQHADISNRRTPTLVIRQEGQAYTKPFVGVMEPYEQTQGNKISGITSINPTGAAADFVGLDINSSLAGNTRKDVIFNADTSINTLVSWSDMQHKGTYAMVTTTSLGDTGLFIGKGLSLKKAAYAIQLQASGAALLNKNDSSLQVMCTQPATMQVPDTYDSGNIVLHVLATGNQYTGTRKIDNGFAVVEFELPAIVYSEAQLQVEETMLAAKQMNTNTVITDTVGRNTIMFSLFPNPTRNNVFLKFNNNIHEIIQLQLFDMNGRCVDQRRISVQGKAPAAYNLKPNLRPGTYILSVKGKQSVGQHKLVIQ